MTPKSSSNRVVWGDPVRVYVTAPPADGEANRAVVEILAKELGVAKSRVEIVKGLSGRDKTVRVEGVSIP